MATLAITTPSSLVLLKPSSLKKPPITVPVTPSPLACAWASDNSSLVIAIGDIIEKCNSTGASLGTLHQAEGTIVALATKDKGNTLVYSTYNQIHFFDASTGKVIETSEAHTEIVTALSLSSDAALLASVSSDVVYVHDLAQSTHTALKGLPAGDITAAAFHTHSRTKLLVGVGSQMLVYDALKPAAPAKVISFEKVSGKIVSISCSPYSRSLIAVACSGGSILIIDLEKDKGPRHVLLRVPIASMVFSAEGGHLYLGTEDGKLLIVDLRALDKPPKSVAVSESGERIVCMSIQSRSRAGEIKPKPGALNTEKVFPPQEASKAIAHRSVSGSSTTTDRKTTTLTVPQTQAKSSAVRTRTVSATASSPRVVIRVSPDSAVTAPNLAPPRIRSRTVSGTSETPSPSKLATMASPKPTRASSKTMVSPLSPRVRKTSSGPDPTPNVKAGTSGKGMPLPRPSFNRAKSDMKDDDNDTVRVEETTKANHKSLQRTRAASTVARVSHQNSRSRTLSTTSQRSQPTKHAPSSNSTVAGSSRPSGSHTKHLHFASQPLSRTDTVSPIPPVPPLPDEMGGDEQLTSIMFTESRTPSPDLVENNEAVAPTMPKKNKGKGRELEVKPPVSANSDIDDILKSADNRGFLGEPDTEIRIQSIEVQRKETENSDAPGSSALLEPEEATIKMTVQISPRPSSHHASSARLPISSPLRSVPSHTHSHHRSDSTHTNNPAHELLQNLIHDAMYDFRRETKAEIIGLHLDLVRMGRGWRKELKEVLNTWTEELKEVREENRKLREENERLRRGY